MSYQPRKWTAFAVLPALALTALADDASAASGSRWSFGYRVGMNVSVDFETGGLPPIVDPQAPGVTAEGRPWNYINGYVFPDVGGSSVDTTYWGYQNLDAGKLPSSISIGDLPNDPSLVNLHRYDSASGDAEESDLLHGVDLLYSRVIGTVSSGHYGFQGGFGYVTTSSKGGFANSIFLQSDQYSGGTPLFPPGHNGPFEATAPEPLLLRTPESSTQLPIPDAVWSGERRFDADLYELKLGGYVEVPLSRRFSLNMNAGGVVAMADTELSVEQSITLVGQGTASDSNSRNEFLFGGYAGADIWYSLTRRWSLFAGGRYQYLQSASVSAGGTTANFGLTQSVFVSAGVGFAF